MKKIDISKVLENIQNRVEEIEDTKTKKIVTILHNVVEYLSSDNTRLREENQKLKDENSNFSIFLLFYLNGKINHTYMDQICC
jgi:FtsZ-binding cell division protein ZapB